MTILEQQTYWQVVINGVEENIIKAKTQEEKDHLQRFLEYYKKCLGKTK
jgi:hypothetical protein